MSLKENYNKAYFVAPLYAKPRLTDAYKKIAEVLTKNQYEVHDDVNKISPEEAKQMNKEAISRYFRKVEMLIRQCDIFIAELTEPSPSVGYEIGYAVANSKPVLILRSDDATGMLGAPFRANAGKQIKIANYKDLKSLEKEIEKFLHKAESDIFIRRLPIEFTKSQIDYLETTKKKENQRSINSTVRLIIERDRERTNNNNVDS
jgi:nucleoside 2-deoxyribosyltransferase